MFFIFLIFFLAPFSLRLHEGLDEKVYLWGSILEKMRMDTLVGALCRVGRGIWPCWARWAGLGVGFVSGGRAVAADLASCVWSRLYMSSSYFHDVFVFIFIGIPDVYHGVWAKQSLECFSWIERRKKNQKTRLLWVLFDLIHLLALFGVYAGIILFAVSRFGKIVNLITVIWVMWSHLWWVFVICWDGTMAIYKPNHLSVIHKWHQEYDMEPRGDACLLLDQMSTSMLRPNIFSNLGCAEGSCFVFILNRKGLRCCQNLGSFWRKNKNKQMRSKSKATVQRLVPVKRTLDGSRHWLCLKQCWRLELLRMLSATVPLSVACRLFCMFFRDELSNGC